MSYKCEILWKMTKSRPSNFPFLRTTVSYNHELCPGLGTQQTLFRMFHSVFVHSYPFFFFFKASGLFHFSLILCIFFSLQLLNRKDKTTFEKLDYLMSKEDNYKRTREYIRSLKMVPSIPYLGRRLNWLIY